jgi:hypothetical protein
MHNWSAARFQNGEARCQLVQFDDGYVSKVAKNIQN